MRPCRRSSLSCSMASKHYPNVRAAAAPISQNQSHRMDSYETYTLHVVCAWIGNSAALPRIITFKFPITCSPWPRKALRNPVRKWCKNRCSMHPPRTAGIRTKRKKPRKFSEALRDAAACRGSTKHVLVRPEGVEPPTYGSEDHCSIQLSYGREFCFWRLFCGFRLPSGKRPLIPSIVDAFLTPFQAASGVKTPRRC